MQLISVTDGSASHPGSERWPVERLSVVRPQESAEALRRLGLPLHSLKWLRGGFADSQVAARETAIGATFIERHLRPNDVVFTTWREDGHCDHEAVGRASAEAAQTGRGNAARTAGVDLALGNPRRQRSCRGTGRARSC